MSDDKLDFGSTFIGMLLGFGLTLLTLWVITSIVDRPQRIVGFPQVGYFTEYKGKVYKLTPPAAELVESAKNSTQQTNGGADAQ